MHDVAWHSHTCRGIPYNHIIIMTVYTCMCVQWNAVFYIGTAAAEEERGRGAATES